MLAIFAINAILFLIFSMMLTSESAHATAAAVTGLRPPELKDTQGKNVGSASTDQLVIISTTIFENRDAELVYAVIVEVRDKDGVTVYLEFQTGTLDKGDSSEIGISWRPNDVGSYELRAFAITNFTSPEILTGVAISQVSVLDACNEPVCRIFGDSTSYRESYDKIQASEHTFVGSFTYDFDDKCQSMILQRCTPYKLDGVSVYTGSENFDEFVGHKVEATGKKHSFELEGYHLEEIWPVRIRVLD